MSTAVVTAPESHLSVRPPPLKTTAVKARAAVVSTRTHLANLDRLLVRRAPPPPLRLPLIQQRTVTAVEPGDDGEAMADDVFSCGGGIRNSLNLSTFQLPSFMRGGKAAVDEMSPRSLAHMQRLLAPSPRLSPRGSLAGDWRRYHGEGAWEELVDPLDQNLRREILRYGDFVQAAYTAFHSMPSPSATQSQHLTVVLPDLSYRPTRSLFATSSLSVPPWARRRSAPSWLTQRSSFVGYVTVCENEREVQRMGRRDIAIVLRGTATLPEWAENLRAGLVPVSDDGASSSSSSPPAPDPQHTPKVAKGFLSLYKTNGDDVPSLSDAIVEEVRRLVELYKGEELSITVVGHSLGASLALLAADELSACLAADGHHRPPPIAVVSFGGPKTGNRAFADRLQHERGVNALRVVNAGDVVTRMPAPIARDGYAHAGGAEVTLDSRDSPCLRPDAGPACCHDLEAYLHLLDGFMGSGRPFRADASRSVARLLAYQRTSVKRAYVERARALGFEPANGSGSAAAAAGQGQHGYSASPTSTTCMTRLLT